MIPYEELVYALSEWRARAGLPVATGATRPAPPAYAPPAPPTAQPEYAAPTYEPPAAYAPPPPPMAAPTPEPPPQPWQSGAATNSAQAMFAQAAQRGAPPPPPAYVGDDSISIVGEEELGPNDVIRFDTPRPGTEPGFAPQRDEPPFPGSRR